MRNEINPKVIRLSIVDDHPVILQGFLLIVKNIKEYKIELSNQFSSGSQVIDNIEHLNSDVLLIDMCLPDIKGYDLVQFVLERYPDMKIGIYSNWLDREYILNAFKNGALGYLLKTARVEEIIEFISIISKGERYVRGVVANVIFESEDFFKKQQNLNITKRELEILQLILNGYRNREIAEKLSIAERTVEFHKQNIYLKLEVSNSIDLYKAAKRLELLSAKDVFV